MADHKAIAAADIHVPGYVQNGDPGAIGAGKIWVDTTTAGAWLIKVRNVANTGWETAGGASGGAPTGADYLTGSAQAGLSAEIVVGTSPGGELGGSWASPTVDASHSGSTHAATQAAAEATASGALSTHAGAADPHTGYRLESADHSHATTGLQGGTVAHTALGGVGATDHHAAPATGPDADVTVDAAGAAGTPSTFARSGHGHKVATSSATPAAPTAAGSAGTSTTAPSRGDHIHPIAVPNVQVFTAGSGNWTKPTGARYVQVEVIGAGGGGGGVPTPGAGYNASAGGGGGGFARKVFAASALGGTEAYAVGAGGTAGANTGGTGGTGGTSSFGAAGTLVQSTGGVGGLGDTTAATAGRHIMGGAGGVGSGGDLNLTGSQGGPGTGSSNTAGAHGGDGGQAPLLSGRAQPNGSVVDNQPSVTGVSFGGGGSGAGVNTSNNVARTGGVGAAGAVIVTTYF